MSLNATVPVVKCKQTKSRSSRLIFACRVLKAILLKLRHSQEWLSYVRLHLSVHRTVLLFSLTFPPLCISCFAILSRIRVTWFQVNASRQEEWFLNTCVFTLCRLVLWSGMLSFSAYQWLWFREIFHLGWIVHTEGSHTFWSMNFPWLLLKD